MSDKSQDSPKSPPPETSTSSEAQPDLATLDDELRRACELTGSDLPMWSSIVDHVKSGGDSTSIVDQIKSGGEPTETNVTCSSDVDQIESRGESTETTATCSDAAKCSQRIKSLLKDSIRSRDVLNVTIARLKESKKTEFELLGSYCKLEDENTRMKENEKLFNSELPKLLSSLKMVKPNVATPSEDNPAAIFRAVRDYLNDKKNQESSASKKIALLETQKKKLTKDLDVAKSNLEQANCKASNVSDEVKQRLLGSQDSLEKATEWGRVIDEMNEVISHIELPQEVVSMDIAHIVKWLADERKKTCEDLGSAKVNLKQANSRANSAEKELKMSKSNLEQANSRAYAAEKELKMSKLNLEQARADAAEKELKMSKLNLEQARADAAEKELEMSKLTLEQANSKASRELDAMKLNLEQAKSELEVRCTELKAAEPELRELEEIKQVISLINFHKEVPPMDTLTSVKWLADYYKNFTDSISGSNEEETKRLLTNMKANIHRKIADELPERIRVIVEAAVEEMTGVENPNPGASHTEHTNILGSTTCEQHSGSGERTAKTGKEAAREEDSNPEASSSAIMADTSHRELEQSRSGTTPAEQDFGSEERSIDEPAADNRYDEHQSTPTATHQLIVGSIAIDTQSVAPGYVHSPQQHIMLWQQQQQQQALPQPPGSVVIAPRAFGTGYWYPPQQHLMLYQQQQLQPWLPGSVMFAPWAFGPGYGYSPHQQFMFATPYATHQQQQQQEVIHVQGQALHTGFDPGYGYSPYQHQQQQFGNGYFHDSSGMLCSATYYHPGDGSAGETGFQGGGGEGRGRGGRGHGQWRGRGREGRGRGRGMEE